MKIKTFGNVDQRAYDQLIRCAEKGNAEYAVLCADHHVGYSQPIGGAIAYEGFVSPSGVGYDIGCGNKAVKTNLKAKDIDVSKTMDEIFRRISFGVGRNNDEKVDHAVLDEIRNASVIYQKQMIDKASNQLGTVGSGNHYVDLFEDEEGWLWVGVHFGSRGFGHATASGFLALSQGKQWGEKASEGEMDAPPTLFEVGSDLGNMYIEAMTLAGKYAYAGRDVVVNKVLEILGAQSVEEIHNHHNFAWKETHFNKDYWVVRKGCTPALPGQKGFVGATMGGVSVILEGVESQDSKDSLYSTVHGAGRVMSRSQALGKSKRQKVWQCGNRDCGNAIPYFDLQPNQPRPTCELCQGRMNKWVNFTKISEGKINWQEALEDLKTKGIELRGAGADEAPGAYKKLEEVLEYHKDTIKILHRLRPIGVAMAGKDVFDPYKD